MDIDKIIITVLSYKKVQLSYTLPIYMINVHNNTKTLIETKNITIRYQKNIVKTRAIKGISKGKKKEQYQLISIGTIIQDTGFRNKVGKVSPTGRSFSQIDPFYETGVCIEDYYFNKVLKEVHVFDGKYLMNFRDKKLSELL